MMFTCCWLGTALDGRAELEEIWNAFSANTLYSCSTAVGARVDLIESTNSSVICVDEAK